MKAYEINFDGIVGPTHHYAGLSYGNLASQKHRFTVSNPKQAALQGLAKMKLLMDLGVKQAVLPPQLRPDLPTLRRLGFTGNDAQIVEKAHREAPRILSACYSASSMWAANAATVSPSADSADGRVHFTPANLISTLHRSIEPPATAAMLKAIFPDESKFAHHPPLLAAIHLADEGAANHTRLCSTYGERGVELFVFGRDAFVEDRARTPGQFPARQTLQASQAIARTHELDLARTIFLQQSPAAIDAGVFHNDVVAVGNQSVLMYHASAFASSPVEQIRDIDLVAIEVRQDEVPLNEAVESYLFNSQLVTLVDGSMAVIAPSECQQFASTRAWLDGIVHRGTPIRSVHYADTRQSMKNGGGPACLRLRVVLNEAELPRVHAGIFLTDALYRELTAWVDRHYRDTLTFDDLRDPKLIDEGQAALQELKGTLRVTLI